MKRLWIAIFVLSCSTAIADRSPTCAVQIMVTTGPGLLITVPCFSKDQLTKMVSTFFARGEGILQAHWQSETA